MTEYAMATPVRQDRDPSGFRLIVGTIVAAVAALTLATMFSGCAYKGVI